MEKYNKRVSTYKHGEVQQTSVNLQTWISTTNECQPTKQQTRVNLKTWRSITKECQPTTKECQPTNMDKYNK